MKPLPWSPSALDTFKNCPHQYLHRYILKDVPLEEKSKEQLYGERYPLDEELLQAIGRIGEAAGIALGIDRLAMLATGVILFTLRGLRTTGSLPWLIAGALLFTEHRAHVLGVLVWLPLLACPLMHIFMHGGHGHGGHGGHNEQNDQRRAS